MPHRARDTKGCDSGWAICGRLCIICGRRGGRLDQRACGTAVGGGAGGGCRRLQPPDGSRRGRHAGPAEVAAQDAGRSLHRRASRPHRQDHRRRHAGRVRQRRRCGALRGRNPARHGRAKRRCAAGHAHRIPDRHPCRRHHHRRQRYFRRRRQHRGPAGGHRRTRRRLHLRRRAAADSRQGRFRIRRHGPAEPEEHRRADARVALAAGRSVLVVDDGETHRPRPPLALPTSPPSRCCRSRT